MKRRPQPPPAGKSELELRAEALEALLAEKGLVSTDAIDAVVELYENDVGPQNGARVIARAWVDPDYRARLLADGAEANRRARLRRREGDALVVGRERAGRPHVIVCTLCSCYPWPVLDCRRLVQERALPRPRRREPRAVLREFGLELGPEVEIRVWDSTGRGALLVMPERPAGTDGWLEDELAALVTRDSMIGTARAAEPVAV